MRNTLEPLLRMSLALAGPLLPCAAMAAEFDCLLEPRQVVELRSPSTGVIERITVERGQFVRVGQVLVVLDSGLERASLEVARQRATMDGPLRSSASRLEFATFKARRRDELVAEKFISVQDRDEAATEKRLAEAESLDARDNRRLAELEVRRNEEQIRLRSIKSPVNGVVMERHAHPGELADPGEQRKPLLRIADIGALHAEAILPAEAYPYVKAGMHATVQATVPVKVHAPAVVKVVDRVLDAASGTFGVRLEVANPTLDIPAGIQCRIDFPQVPASLQRKERRPSPAG
jgi:RND family efflux transporter MFP subunit